MESNHQKQEQLRHNRRKPRLERRNAVKNILYEASPAAAPVSSSSPDHESSSSSSVMVDLRTRSMDLNLPSSYTSQTSFRIIGGIDGEVDLICQSLGLSGPEDFAIPAAAWEARKARCSSDILPRSRLLETDDSAMDNKNDEKEEINVYSSNFGEVRVRDEVRVRVGDSGPELVSRFQFPLNAAGIGGGGGGGIRGARPPVLSPPPAMSLPKLDKTSSTWDILKSLAPENQDVFSNHLDTAGDDSSESENDEEAEGEEDVVDSEEDEGGIRLGVTAGDLTVSCSFSTSNDDDSSSTTTEAMYISPNGRFKRNIESWMRGRLLGSGSFGTVYEGISEDGFFFAVKEVSLLDQGSNAQQCIQQLEQEIALLSQFEHENIVQYLGTDKEEAKLYIFIELVTQGSLASLYQKYHLRDSQASAYTRQILHGLKYLHDRNVVHRDIKCANILVDASGSVKLADFGLAKETSKLNMLKSCKGSIYWMAPEVANPRTTYGPAADIWSLGCTVLEMLTRQLPYPNLEWASAFFKIGRGEQPPIPSSLSKDARDFIRQCVQVNPGDRPCASKLLDHPFVKRPLPVSASPDSSVHHNNRHAAKLSNFS